MEYRAASAILLFGLCLLPASVLLSGCESVEFGAATLDTATDAAGTASLAFTNRRETDAGALTLNLYRANADWLTVPIPEKVLGTAGVGETRTFSAPAGRWKLGYEDEVGTFHPMPLGTVEGESQDWPVVTFEKDAGYQVVIETDEGNHTVWRTNVPKAD